MFPTPPDRKASGGCGLIKSGCGHKHQSGRGSILEGRGAAVVGGSEEVWSSLETHPLSLPLPPDQELN